MGLEFGFYLMVLKVLYIVRMRNRRLCIFLHLETYRYIFFIWDERTLFLLKIHFNYMSPCSFETRKVARRFCIAPSLGLREGLFEFAGLNDESLAKTKTSYPKDPLVGLPSSVLGQKSSKVDLRKWGYVFRNTFT